MSPHQRAALLITGGAAAFGLLLARMLSAMMADPNFGRGDNPFELIAVLGGTAAVVLALVTASALAFRHRWAAKAGYAAVGWLILTVVAMVTNFAIAGAAETGPTSALQSAETFVGVMSFAGAIGLYRLIRPFQP